NLRSLANTCNFNNLRDGLIHDRIVVGIRDNRLRTKLLSTPDLDLQKCVNICRSAEKADKEARAIAASTSCTENVFKVSRTSLESSSRAPAECRFCGQSHIAQRERCPAWGKQCYKCSRYNHFAAKCGIMSGHSNRFRKSVNAITDDSETLESEELLV